METQSKRVYSGHTHTGDVDMAEISGDRDKLREAILLLMDRRWGLKRIEQCAARIRLLPHYSRPFVGTAAPCNYLLQLVKENQDNMVPVLQLLNTTKQRHIEFWAKFDEENEKFATTRKAVITNTRRLRLCYQQGFTIEAYKLGRSLTKAEQEDVAKQYHAMWERWKEEYFAAHSTGPFRERLKGYAATRDERMKKMYDSVINSPSQFGIKKLSDVAEARRLKIMEKHAREF